MFYLITAILCILAVIALNLNKTIKYLNGPNPLGQFFFLILSFCVIYGFYATEIWDSISDLESALSTILILCTNLVFALSCASDPGIINAVNHKELMSHFKYDYILYSPKECRTCRFLKIPRSKHCSVCNRCISRQDHHCVWLNNCVGYNNFYLFSLFLFITWITTTYLATLGYKFLNHTPRSIVGEIIGWKKFTLIFSFYPMESGWFLFACFASFMVSVFSLFALYPSFRGQTLNEYIKWDELNESLKHEPVFMEQLIFECNQNGMEITSDILERASKSPKIKISETKFLRNIYSTGTFPILEMIWPWIYTKKKIE